MPRPGPRSNPILDMKSVLRFLFFPSWLAVMPLQAPIHIGLDARDYYRTRIIAAVARIENCIALRNEGCLRFAGQPGAKRGPRGFARFSTKARGRAALEE